MGYSSTSKAYVPFQPYTVNFLIDKDVHFMKNEQQRWNDAKKEASS